MFTVVNSFMASPFCSNDGLFSMKHSNDGLEFLFQDDTTFEKQSALFALAVADIVIINM